MRRSPVVARPAAAAARAAARVGNGTRCTTHPASGAVRASKALANAASSVSVTAWVPRARTRPPVADSLAVSHHSPRASTKPPYVVTVTSGVRSSRVSTRVTTFLAASIVRRTTRRPSAEVTTTTGPGSTAAVPGYSSQRVGSGGTEPLSGGRARSAGFASRRNAKSIVKRLTPSHHSVVVAVSSVPWRTAQRRGPTNSVARYSPPAWPASG